MYNGICIREEHSVIGGLGEAVRGLLGEKLLTPGRHIGVGDEFGPAVPPACLKTENPSSEKPA